MAENKITEDQLNKIHDFQKEIRTFLIEVGAKEAEKHALLHRLVGVNEKQEELKKELETEYGSININLEDGSYEVIKGDE
jgi:allophanate hydrolase subunit 1